MKKTSLFILFLAACLTLVSCGIDSEDVSNQIKSIEQSENEYVLGVKGGSPNSFPDTTYEDAFDYFFAYPTWTYFEGSRDDDDKTYDVVEFTGNCMYYDKEVKALIQFTISDDFTTFEPTYLSFNDVPQTMDVLVVLIEKAFTEYEESMGMEANKATPSN